MLEEICSACHLWHRLTFSRLACKEDEPSVSIAKSSIAAAAKGLMSCSKLGRDSSGPVIAFKYGDTKVFGAPTLRTKGLDAGLTISPWPMVSRRNACFFRYVHKRKTSSVRAPRTAPIVLPMIAPRFNIFLAFLSDLNPEDPGISIEELESSGIAFVGTVERPTLTSVMVTFSEDRLTGSRGISEKV